jgi:Tfp pilus assembly protein PilX
MSTNHATTRRGERGSAYVAVLLALVVLTIIGLSLVMVTQTEVQLGANERTITRTLYGADSGIQISVVRHLLLPNDDAFTFIQNRAQLGGVQIAERVQTSQFKPISTANCDWCPANENGDKYVTVNNTVTSTGQRVSWSGTGLPPTDAKVLAQSQVTVMLRIINSPSPSLDSLR